MIRATILVADLGARMADSRSRTPRVSPGGVGDREQHRQGPACSLTRRLDQLLKRSRRTRSSLRGTAIGVPGPVNLQAGRIARSISMPGWDDYPVQDHLADYFGVPAVMDNDANLMGLGEQRRIYPNAHQVLFIKVGTGIGASVIIDGELLGYRFGRRRHWACQDHRG